MLKASKLERACGGADIAPPTFRRYLYAAYGMNTARAGMLTRCPHAVPAGVVLLRNHKLVFRGVADVTFSLGRQVHLALWWFTEACETSLDRLEGFRQSDPDGGLYGKRWFTMKGDHPLAGRDAMLYVMNSRDYVSTPSESYERMLRTGYSEFNMPAAQIDRAIAEAQTVEAARPRAVQYTPPSAPLWTPTRQSTVFDARPDDDDEEEWEAYTDRLRALRGRS
jgi:hypothetical protein